MTQFQGPPEQAINMAVCLFLPLSQLQNHCLYFAEWKGLSQAPSAPCIIFFCEEKETVRHVTFPKEVVYF